LDPERVVVEAQFYNITLPPLAERKFKTKIVAVQYHSFDDIASFRNKLELEISIHESKGWKFVQSHKLSGASMNQYGVDESSNEPPSYLLYFRKKGPLTDQPAAPSSASSSTSTSTNSSLRLSSGDKGSSRIESNKQS